MFKTAWIYRLPRVVDCTVSTDHNIFLQGHTVFTLFKVQGSDSIWRGHVSPPPSPVNITRILTTLTSSITLFIRVIVCGFCRMTLQIQKPCKRGAQNIRFTESELSSESKYVLSDSMKPEWHWGVGQIFPCANNYRHAYQVGEGLDHLIWQWLQHNQCKQLAKTGTNKKMRMTGLDILYHHTCLQSAVMIINNIWNSGKNSLHCFDL